MRRFVLGSGAVVIAAACQTGGFACNDDLECAGSGAIGVCETVGACSFPDEACASGRRYGDAGPHDVAGTCVAGGGTSTDATTTTTATATTVETTVETTVDPVSTATLDGSSGADDDSTTTGAASCPPDWWDCAWAHRHHLTLAAPLGERLEDVPALVLLGGSRIDYEHLQADGEDLRFVTLEGVTVPFEIEQWDPLGISSVWISVPQLGAGADDVWIYYGNPVARDAQDAARVWAAPHAAVWHLGEPPIDVTANAGELLINGEVPLVTGQIATARYFAGGSARLDAAASGALADVFSEGGTVSAWIRPHDWGANGLGRIVHKESAGVGWLFYVAENGRLRFAFNFVGGPITWSTADGVIAPETWAHVALTFRASAGEAPRAYVDGAEVVFVEGGVLPEAPPLLDLDVPLTIGNRPANDRRFNGRIDEVRVERIVRSGAWIQTQAESARDALFVFGPRESLEVAR